MPHDEDEEFEPCVHMEIMGWAIDAAGEAEKAASEIIDPHQRALAWAAIGQVYATLAAG